VSLTVDLSADIGDAGAAVSDLEAALLPLVTSISLACGLHAGTPDTMRAALVLAREHGVAVGAHPGLPDPGGQGRRERAVAPAEVERLVAGCVAACAALAADAGVALQHVKAHGALYNMAAREPALAAALVAGVTAVNPHLRLFAPAGSAMARAAVEAGLGVVHEAFADRSYEPDGSLTPRGRPGAVIEDATVVATRAVEMVTTRSIEAVDGSRLALDVETLCVHGDTPGALALARSVRAALEQAGIRLAAPAG